MHEMDWLGSASATRRTDVRRRLVIDRRSYDVTALEQNAGTVAMRIVGWDSGYRFMEFDAEIPSADATDVGQLIASALAGFRGGTAQRVPEFPPHAEPPDEYPEPLEDWQAPDLGPRSAFLQSPAPLTSTLRWQPPPNAGKPWAPHDLDLLVSRFREGASIRTLTEELGRTDGAIRSRLQVLGETRGEQDPPTRSAELPADAPDPSAASAGSLDASGQSGALVGPLNTGDRSAASAETLNETAEQPLREPLTDPRGGSPRKVLSESLSEPTAEPSGEAESSH